MGTQSSQVPNYTLISERGVKIFDKPEQIIEIFAAKRLEVVKKRYELLVEDYKNKITQNNEIIKFIKKKEYDVATKSKNRKTFVEYLQKKKYHFAEYLADMPIYRMTKEEVAKRQLLVKEDTKNMKECEKIAKSSKLIAKKLVEELNDVKTKLTDWLKKKDQHKQKILKDLEKAANKRKKKKH